MSLTHYPLPSPPSEHEDESDCNKRMCPYWPAYRPVLLRRGFRLDTVRDVKQHYSELGLEIPFSTLRYMRREEDDLCPDVGLPDNLFRGTCIRSGGKVVVKAVHRRSREVEIIRYLSTPPIRDHPMNHSIPVLDLIRVPQDKIILIVMQEWSPDLVPFDNCLESLINGVRQCIEHVAFMHRHRIAHLDISLHNVLANYDGRYAFIDYEGSRRFDESKEHCMAGYRGTEVPPECERGQCTDPYKIDVWALAIFILRICKLSGNCMPELLEIIKPMLNENPDERPTAQCVLKTFDTLPLIGYPPR